MKWLMNKQKAIKASLTKRHLHNKDIVFYDLSLIYIESKHYPLERFEYSYNKIILRAR